MPVPADPAPELCDALAADLRAADYTSERLRTLWGADADDALGRGQALPARRSLAGDTSDLAVLARLFALGDAVRGDAVRRALPHTSVDGIVALGLAEATAAEVRPLAMIRPQPFVDDDGAGEWWIASDLDEAALGGALPEDHVLGVGQASLTLAGLQLTTPAARVLDLGTGCGIQALRASRAADAIVATDTSGRALAMTRLNARLNDVTQVETRIGSLFDPVAGERFDRIVSNPPFVITPRAAGVPAYEYRDGGLVGDALVEAVVSGVGRHLEPGGVAQLLGNWETRDDMSGLDRIRRWVDASPVALDAWVVERDALDPIAYAQLWIRDGGTLPGTPRYDALLEAWLDDFETRGVTAIGFGYVLLRRPAGGVPSLARYETLTQPITENGLGAHLARCLDAHDRLASWDDSRLEAAVLRVAPDVTEIRHHLPGMDDPTVIELRQGAGYARTLQVDTALAGLVGACDGALSVGAIVAALAELLEEDAAALRADLLPRVRESVFTGFLEFDEPAP